MADELDDREPIFWTNARPGFNDRDRQSARMENGRRIVEKFPQHGHVGEYDNKQQAPGQRFVYMIRHDGHEGAICLTNAAAHLDPNSAYGQYVRMKARFLGWFGVADCPVAMVQIGRITEDHIVDKSILEERPCGHGLHTRRNPCPHAVREKAARTAAHNALQAERLASYKDNGEKMLEAQHAQTDALVQAITAALGRGVPFETAANEAIAQRFTRTGDPVTAPVVDAVTDEVAGEPKPPGKRR